MNTIAMPPQQMDDNKSGVLNSVPAWGSYLYQNFLLPAFSPSEWLANTPSSSSQMASSTSLPNDYFGNPGSGSSWAEYNLVKPEPEDRLLHQLPPPPPPSTSFHPASVPSSYYGHPSSSYYAQGIQTSLLVSQQSSSGDDISPSVDVIEHQVAGGRSPSPVSTLPTPHLSLKLHLPHGIKRRASSMDSESPDEQDAEAAEGVERDGMIWGMRVEDYRALSARERKRVRNRISARTFRAKRKEHLSSLEIDLSSKDSQIKSARDEASRLRLEVASLRKRLSQYEAL